MKIQLRSLYAKLGAHNRDEAVSRAHALGMLHGGGSAHLTVDTTVSR